MDAKPFTWNFRGRKSIRLRTHNYAEPGDYFVTICTKDRKCLFGIVQNGVMQLNDVGRIVEHQWLRTAEIRPNVSLGPWVIMPNHVHMIVTIRHDDQPRYVTVGAHTLCPEQDREHMDIQPGSDNTVIPLRYDDQPRSTVGATRWVAPNRKMQRTTRWVAPNQDGTAHQKTEMSVGSIGATQRVAPTGQRGPTKGSVGAIIGQFKQATARRIRRRPGQSSLDVWQRNYWESCINTERQYANVEEYILNNPAAWDRDELNPAT
ncbi:MAG TPA: hypothetical protein VN397_04880 [Candidatus Methylomirabilis sp.]|nr:hypothetical protein [Candidatus Methylomirabilis sp.]